MNAPGPSRLLRTDRYDDGVVAWAQARLAPPPALAGLIDGYCDYAERRATSTTQRELPHGDGVLIVNLGAPIAITGGDDKVIRLASGEAFVAGAHLRPALSHAFGAQSGVHVYLPLESLRRLLGVPLDRLVDQVQPLDALLGADAQALGAALLDAQTPAQRVGALDAALTRIFAARPALPAAQVHALALLRRRPDLCIAEIARDIGWSRKHLAARTRDAIGIGPRSFRRVLRFHRLTKALRGTPRPDWAMAALDAGYCDQSHMIREFREFAETTPGDHIAAARA